MSNAFLTRAIRPYDYVLVAYLLLFAVLSGIYKFPMNLQLLRFNIIDLKFLGMVVMCLVVYSAYLTV